MCGQFHIDSKDILYLSKKYSLPKRVPINDIKPKQMALVLLKNHTGDLYQFGFQGQSLLINARSETILEKPTFKNKIENRCIVPASSFYEWDAFKNKITFTNHDILYFAALYDNKRFVLLTTQANDSVKRIHNRMPLILTEEEVESWLNEKNWQYLLDKIGPSLENNQKIEQLSLF